MSTLKELNEHKKIFNQEKKAIKTLKEMAGSKTTDSILKQLKKEHKKTKKIIQQLEDSMTYEIYNGDLIIYLDLLHEIPDANNNAYIKHYDLDIDIINYMRYTTDLYLKVSIIEDDSFYEESFDCYFKDTSNDETLLFLNRECKYSSEKKSRFFTISLKDIIKYGVNE